MNTEEIPQQLEENFIPGRWSQEGWSPFSRGCWGGLRQMAEGRVYPTLTPRVPFHCDFLGPPGKSFINLLEGRLEKS